MSNQPGVLVQNVAESLCIHPFMLSRWRKQPINRVSTDTKHVPSPGRQRHTVI
jgi:hypothetical protein